MSPTKKQRTLDVLRDRQWHSNTELVNAGCGYRYGAQIHELRKDGYLIETKSITFARWEYRLRRLSPVAGAQTRPKRNLSVSLKKALDLLEGVYPAFNEDGDEWGDRILDFLTKHGRAP